jgi:hypothetical protein
LTTNPHPATIVPRRSPADTDEQTRLWLAVRDAIHAFRAERTKQTGHALVSAYGAYLAALPDDRHAA